MPGPATPISNLHLLPDGPAARSLPGQVQEILLEAILSRVLVPGERLLVDGIAERFGISKIPVREALKALEVGGWLETQARRGTYVRSLSVEELHEIFELRRLIEPYAARKAALRRTNEHLEALRELNARGRDAISRGDVQATARINSEFHSKIAAAVGNRLLGQVCADLEARLRRYLGHVNFEQRRDSFVEHERIYEAIRDQDADRVERLTIQHLQTTEVIAAAWADNAAS